MAPSLCVRFWLLVGGGGVASLHPPPWSDITIVVWHTVPYPLGYVKVGGPSGPPTPDNEDDVSSPSRSRTPVHAGDNIDKDVPPITGVDVVIKNGDNIENLSAAQDDNVPVITFDRGEDGDSDTGAASEVSHAKGTKSASKIGRAHD